MDDDATRVPERASFCRKLMQNRISDTPEAKPLECGSVAAAFHNINIINHLKAAAPLPHSKAPFGRSLSTIS